MANIRIEVNTLALRAKVSGITGLIKETLWLNRVGDRHAEWISDNIQQGGALGTVRWRAMARNTVAARPNRRSRRHFSSAFEQRLVKGTFKQVSGSQVTVGINAEHADLHHLGTSPHTITARRANMLRFMTTKGLVFVKRVQHPGFPARPLLPTKKRGRDIAIAAIQEFVKEIRKRGNR